MPVMPIPNTATASGQPPQGGPVTDTDDEVVTVEQAPAVQIVKALVSPDPPVGVGARLVYSLTVVNTGNTTLTDLVVTDSRAAATVDCDPAPGDPVEHGRRVGGWRPGGV